MKKKTGLFKIILFVLLGIMLLTWIIPASYYYTGELTDLGMYRIGFFDFFQLLFGAFEFSYFIQMALLLVAIGALYGVLEKTGTYTAWIEKIASKFKGKEKVFLIVTAFVIAAITSAFDFGFSTFIFIPFIISIILAMKYDKITALVTTFGAYFVGIIGSTINYNVVGVTNGVLTNLTLGSGIWYKIALFVLSFGALAFYLLKQSKTIAKNEKVEDKFIGEKSSSKKPVWPIIVILSVLFVLLVLGCVNWSAVFGVDFFSELHTTITSWTIGETDVANIVLGNVAALGEWFYAEMAVMCLLAALLIGAIYGQKGSLFTNMYNGAKKLLPSALIVMFVYAVVYFAGNTMFFPTIAGWILGATSKFNIFLASITTILGSALHVDMLYISSYVIEQVASTTTNQPLVAVLLQGMYGVTGLIAPTSAMLVLGLSYLEINYKEWVKKSWLLIVELLIIALVISLLVAII